jgi:hypothetical protein
MLGSISSGTQAIMAEVLRGFLQLLRKHEEGISIRPVVTQCIIVMSVMSSEALCTYKFDTERASLNNLLKEKPSIISNKRVGILRPNV